jgi:hypothetical protein
VRRAQGQKDLAKFAKGLSRAQRRALGIRRQADSQYPAPSQPTFCRLMKHIHADELEKLLLQVQEQLRGPAPPDELIVLDGKQPRQGGGQSVLSAVTVPSLHYLGSAIVDTKTNEIPVARALFHHLDLDGRKVSLDALHTQDQTARELVLEHGADYLLTVKDNQPTLRANIEQVVPAPPAGFPPLQHRRRRWPPRVNSTRGNSKSGCYVPARPVPSRWTFLASNKWRCCGGTSATTARKRSRW